MCSLKQASMSRKPRRGVQLYFLVYRDQFNSPRTLQKVRSQVAPDGHRDRARNVDVCE